MRCKDCNACTKGWFESRPNEYVCIGVKEPFIIDDINTGCTQYKDRRNITGKEYICKNFTKEELIEKMIIDSCVEEFGIETECSRECEVSCKECWNSKVIAKICYF